MFFFIPSFAAISSTGRPYQYRATKRLRSVSGWAARKALKLCISSLFSIACSTLKPEGMHSASSSSAMSASPLPRFAAERRRSRSTEMRRVSAPKYALRQFGRVGGMAFHAASHVSFTLSSESPGSRRMPSAMR